MSETSKDLKNILWIMGPTSSGKTSLSAGFAERMKEMGRPSIHFDGDEIRDMFGTDLSFSSKDRLRVIRALVHFANKSLYSGLTVVVSALTANPNAREFVRQNAKNLITVSIICGINKCIERDVKGLYKKAINGEIDTLIGFNTEYVSPENPDIIINTEKKNVTESVDDLINSLNSYLRKFRHN